MSEVFAACAFFVVNVGVHIGRNEHLKTAWALAAVFATELASARSYLAFSSALNANPSRHIFLAIIAVTVVCLRPMTMLLIGSEHRQRPSTVDRQSRQASSQIEGPTRLFRQTPFHRLIIAK
ncbi:hypothetical protein PY650_09325 [Rhizobium calliandrae]|uniref:Cation/H+ exchanger domain-containing protein n=1 Tax=Rhizobium calliandrae TaxID=1312182 RepID=A0ABT7KEW6_9HYPH|nr:hypothetical protein [Rhizobium calliandrae]MDL2405863.1 hypothetical protein [Rhizobium calliandrae]